MWGGDLSGPEEAYLRIRRIALTYSLSPAGHVYGIIHQVFFFSNELAHKSHSLFTHLHLWPHLWPRGGIEHTSEDIRSHSRRMLADLRIVRHR